MSTDVLDSYPTLYVSGLPPTITELDMVKVLNEMKVESKVIIERDPVTSVPLGRIKIIFRYQPDAERFFATVNGSMFLGSKVHLTFKDPNMNFSNTSGSKAIVVKHLPLGVTSLEFYDAVRAFGRIISCKVMIDRSGNECYALLQFEAQDAADKCLQEMNGAIFKGNTIALSWQFPKNSPYQYPTKGQTQPGQQRTSWKGETPPPGESRTTPSPGWQTTSGQWNQQQQSGGWSQGPTPPTTPQWQAGQAPTPNQWQSSSQTPPAGWSQGAPPSASNNWSQPPSTTNPATGWHPSPATSPTTATSGTGGARWEQQPPIDGAPPLDDKNLYVKNLEDHIDNLELFNMFRKFGRIVSARVMRDDATGRSKGFGFVSYESGDQAQRALRELNGKRYGTKTLIVNIAEPKGYREKKLAAIHANKPTSPQNGVGAGPSPTSPTGQQIPSPKPENVEAAAVEEAVTPEAAPAPVAA